MKKSLVLALVAALVLSFASMAFAFTDVPEWAKTQVDKLAELKIVDGTATTFNSTKSVTRAEFAKMIVVAKGLSLENPTTATFSDVATTNWAFPYVEAAAKAKLIEGYNGKFDPNANITREQVAKIIVLAAGKAADATLALNFDDKASISDWAKGFVAQAANLKLMQGSNNKFAPKANTTRAEGAVLVYNELAYEGKVVVPVAADQITDINIDAAGQISTLTIGGKVLDVDNSTTNNDDVIYVNGQEVNGFAVVKDTHAKATLNSKGDKVLKLELAAADYASEKGKVTAKGDGFVYINDKKITFDTNKSDYSMNIISDDKVVLAADKKAKPELDATYFVLFDKAAKSYFWLQLDEADVKDKVGTVGKDSTGYFLTIGDKKYYVPSSNKVDIDGTPTTVAASEPTWVALPATYVEITLNSDGTLKAIVTKSSYKGYVASKPVFVLDAASGKYDVYVEVLKDASKIVGASTFYVHYNADKSNYIKAADVPDNAIIGAIPAGTKVELERNAGITIDGTSRNLGDIKVGSYLTVNRIDSKFKSVTVKAASVKGIITGFEKDVNDYVTAVEISGTKFSYIGPSAANTSSTKGYVYVQTTETLVEKGDIVTGALNADGNLVGLVTAQAADVEDATVVGLGGDKSKASKSDAVNALYIPANTLEVEYTSGGVKKLAWVSYSFTDTDKDATLDGTEIEYTLVAKANVYASFSDIKIGSVVSIDTAAAAVPFNKEILPKYLRTSATLGSTVGCNDVNADASAIYNNAIGTWDWDVEGRDSTDAGVLFTAAGTFKSVAADYIVIQK